MHISTSILLALLPAAIANDQAPLKDKAAGWLDKAKAYVSAAAPEIPNPIDAGASKVAAAVVEKVNIRNYERKLGPKPDGEEEWLVYITGGNKTCRGFCDKPNRVWNESVAILSALEPFSGSTLKLGTVNCEVEEVLCTAWAAAVPSIFHFIFPQKVGAGQSQAASPLHDIPLNFSSISVDDITSIPRASKSRYLTVPEYKGAFHPIDGELRRFGLLKPVGYVLWGLGTTPSWLFMIGISFFSRQMMARRAGRAPGIDGRPGVGGTPAPPPANAASAARAGGKKRK